MEAYKQRRREWNMTLKSCRGGGHNSQHYADGAYERMAMAHAALSPEEQAAEELPKPEWVGDDRTGGVATGLSTMVADGCNTQ